jgi:sugar/nucleoside kinase (ribokinase family)
MGDTQDFDVAFIGQYTKDTIVNGAGTRVIDGGAYFYGSSAAARMGLRTAAVTRLAAADFRSFAPLRELGVAVFARETRESTCLRLEYPSDDPDDRILSVSSVADPFVPGDLAGVKAGAWSVGASIRGEVGLPVLEALAATGARIGLDAQGYVRVVKDGTLAYDRAWEERDRVLALVDVFKADVVEAQILTGHSDLKAAAAVLLRYGPKELVLTHKDGVLVYAEGTFHEAPFKPLSLVGRTGRGDTCLASYLCARLSMPPARATRWAAALTSLKMESAGPFCGSNEDVERVLRERF